MGTCFKGDIVYYNTGSMKRSTCKFLKHIMLPQKLWKVCKVKTLKTGDAWIHQVLFFKSQLKLVVTQEPVTLC